MHARLAAAALAATLALVAAPALAEVKVIARAGAWQAFGGVSDDKREVCGISTSGDGMWFGVKYFKGDDGFAVQMSSSDWTVKKGEKVRVTMRFDRRSPWSGTAVGFFMADGDAALELEIPTRRLDAWIREFRAARALSVGFPDAPDVEDWEVGLSGTTAITDRMIACIDAM